MVKPYQQDMILDVDGKPIYDAFARLDRQVANLAKNIRQIGQGAIKDAKDVQKALDANIAALKKAKSDLNALREFDTGTRGKAYDNAESATIKRRMIEAKTYYREKERLAREEASVERQLAKEVADYEKMLDRQKVATSREVAAARKEAAQAAITAKARGITDVNDASAAKAASDMRLRQLRIEREMVAKNNVEAARGLADRINLERILGRELDANIRKLTAEQQAATRRLTGSSRLLAPGNVRDAVAANGGNTKATLLGYQFQQEAARRELQAVMATTNATKEQIVAAQQKLTLANQNVAAAKKLHSENERILATDRKIVDLQSRMDHKVQVKLAGQYAREQIAAVGPAQALLFAKERTAIAEERLAMARGRAQAAAMRDLELARKQQTEIEKQGSGGSNPLDTILSGRYAAAAFARTAVYGAAAAAAYGVFNAFSAAATSTIEFEDELAKLAAIADATPAQMEKVSASILQVATSSRFSVVDLTKITQQLAQAGVTVGEMTTVLQSVTTLANASGSTPDEAVNLVTAALGSFQLQADQAARVADLMTSALNRTKLTVPQVAQAIQYVGATAFEQNISLEQMLATIGAIAQAGVRSGSTIGTGFRQFLVDLQNPTEKLSEQLKLLGLSAADVDVGVRGLPAVLETLRDAGFGAGQAYEALEVRAAAFYLTAKNNIDIIDKLQLAFAMSGSAAQANERAMNSLTAQWQRFKNLLFEFSSGFGQQIVDDLKETVETMADLLAKINEYQRTKPGQEKTLGQMASSVAGYTAAGAGAGAGVGALFGGIGAVPGAVTGGFIGLGTGIEAQFTGAAEAVRDYATATSDATEKVDKQTSIIGELDKELQRLITQKSTLRDNDVRSSAEIATLSSRFEGLGLYLTATGTRYDDLVQAMERYRLKQQQILGLDLVAQQSALTQETKQAVREKRQQIQALQGDSSSLSQLNKRERDALDYVQRFSGLRKDGTNDPKWQMNYEIIASASQRLAEDFPKLSQELNEVVQNLSKIAYNTSVGQNTDIQIANNKAARTPLGQQTQNTLRAVESIVTLLGSAEGSRKDGLATRGLSSLDKLEKTLKERLPKITEKGNRDYVNNALRDIATLRQQITASTTPTKSETREAERAARQASRDTPLPPVSISEIERILGTRATSGLRSVAENKRVGGAANSYHLTGNGVDFGLRDKNGKLRTKAQIRAALEAAGIEIKELLGPGDKGHADHFHIGFSKKRKGADQIAEQAEAYNGVLDRNQLELDQQALTQSLKQMAKATTKETFDAAVAASKLALDKVNEDIESAALNELAAKDVSAGDPEYDIKMRQVQQTIEQNFSDYQQRLADALVKNLAAMTKAAELKFEEALNPARNAKAIADARVSGLSYFSNRNNVPDFMRELLNQRASSASEGLDRARGAALPGLIQDKEAALAETVARRAALDPNEATAYETATQTIDAYAQSIALLRQEKAALDAAFSVSAEFPQTLKEGLDGAIQAYRTANDMNQTFTQSLILNLGGGIETVHAGLEQMFASILDGSQNALQAFGNFAKGIMSWITQMVAKLIATKILELLFSVVGGSFGSAGLSSTPATGASSFSPGIGTGRAPMTLRFNGGPADDGYIRRATGGSVENGNPVSDSVRAKLAKGEWVVQKKAVDSVGDGFMARLNQHGSKALDALNSVPSIDMKNHTETNVYVVPPQQKPSLGKNDVLVIMQDEMMNGESKRLIQHISREG